MGAGARRERGGACSHGMCCWTGAGLWRGSDNEDDGEIIPLTLYCGDVMQRRQLRGWLGGALP